MDIQVGDRVTFNNGVIMLIYASNMIDGWKKENIIKIERIGEKGWYTVYEKKELLTEEEREFLKNIVKWYDVANIRFCTEFISIEGIDRYICCPNYPKSLDFKKVTRNKDYTLSELGLEE